jgi:hypothetical protein
MMKTSRAHAPTKDSSRGYPASHVRTTPTPLDFDRVIANLSATLIEAGAERIEATMPDRPARLVIHEKEMDEAFAALGKVVARGTEVSIHGEVLPIETVDQDGDKGCALLAVSVNGRIDDTKTGVRDALSVVRAMVEKESGFLRFRNRPREMRLSFYLPILH